MFVCCEVEAEVEVEIGPSTVRVLFARALCTSVQASNTVATTSDAETSNTSRSVPDRRSVCGMVSTQSEVLSVLEFQESR